MPSTCCIRKCTNSTKNGFHLFRFPLGRPDTLKMWIDAIGFRITFYPTKNYLICSAHFVATDFMERPNASGVRLKNLAVPSIFFEDPAIESGTTPAIESGISPAIESGITPAIESGITPAIESGITPAIESGMRKPKKIMSSSLLSLKKQEMSPWKKRMLRMIKSLKQNLMRKEKKIHSLENLLKNLRYENKF